MKKVALGGTGEPVRLLFVDSIVTFYTQHLLPRGSRSGRSFVVVDDIRFSILFLILVRPRAEVT